MWGKTQSFLLCFPPVCLLYQSHKKLNFWSPNVWSFFSPTKQFSVTPAGYPTIQPNSDILPGESIRFQRLREQSHNTALPPSDASRKPKLSPCFWSTNYRLGVPTTLSLDSINLLEHLTELRETLTYIFQFIKGCDEGHREQRDEEIYSIGRSLGGS